MSPHVLDDDARAQFGLVGDSPQLQRVLRTIQKLSEDRSPVLICGESGTGKELVSRAIHAASSLREEVFLPVDAASLATSLMETELFGSVRGSYTSSVTDKKGLVREADGGTLFLDEIGELTTEVQAKLLRLLQEGEIRPVGATRPIKVTVRMLAATNRELENDVEAGTFRRDLFHRLNVIRLDIPPLRERRGDIPTLIRHFSLKHDTGRTKEPLSVSDDALRVLMEYAWPGNVRELENIVRRWVVLKTHPLVEPPDLPEEILRGVSARLPVGSYAEKETIIPLAEIERREIVRAVRITHGDVGTAALMLGIGRTTLYRKLKQYSVRTEDLRRDSLPVERPDGGLPSAERLSNAGRRGGQHSADRRDSVTSALPGHK